MTTKEVIALAKDKLGRDITEKDAQDYLNGKAEIPDEALSLVSGGGEKCSSKESCNKCGSTNLSLKDFTYTCNDCGNTWGMTMGC